MGVTLEAVSLAGTFLHCVIAREGQRVRLAPRAANASYAAGDVEVATVSSYPPILPVELMSSFRRRDYLQEGRCYACNLRVSSVFLHQQHLCRVLAQEVVGPATFDSDGTGDSD